MGTYTVKLLEKKEIVQGTMSCVFEKPQGFIFKPGQYCECTLLNPKEIDEKGSSRCFSIASAPYESTLMIATRMRDTAFKRCLKEIPIGTELRLEGPGGSFTLHTKATTPAVFLTGGIGITPVRSIVLQAAHDRFPHRIFLLYSNKSPDTAAFLKELIDLEKLNARYSCITTMTDIGQSSSHWSGHVGHIESSLLAKYIGDITAPIYYICGPQSMVTAMHSLLNEAGVIDDNIKMEEFSGY